MRRLIYILLLVSAMSLSAKAQSKGSKQDDTKPESLQQSEIASQREFFDPTKKKDKVREEYQFSCDWRLEVGYAQEQQRTKNDSYMNPFLHGARLGATVDFNLPVHFSIQTGLLYQALYGRLEQHFGPAPDREQTQVEYLQHRVLSHQLAVPIRAYYTQNLWKDLNMFWYAGPQLQFTFVEKDYVYQHLSEQTLGWLQGQGLHTDPYDRIGSKELYPVNIQFGLGGGLEWAKYRLVAGYDFGLNNLVKTKRLPDQHMWEWGWYVSFSYKL